MSYNPNNANGAATAANSAPVAVATDQIGDVLVTGQSGQSTLGNNILLASAGSGSVDCMAGPNTYRSFTAQIIGSTGISSGQILFEQSNDNATWIPAQFFDLSNGGGGGLNFSAVSIAASTNKFYIGRIYCRYLRCRISTGFVGGTVQAITRYSFSDTTSGYTQVVAPFAAAAWVVNSVPSTGIAASLTVTTASTNAVNVVASSRQILGYWLSNPTATAIYVKLYNKATAPTVGTDVPVLTVPVPAGQIVTEQFTNGLRFAAGISTAATGALADSDTSNGVAGVKVNMCYTF